ncbi:MAG: tRNA (adenosine(37)-N6)-threonylcarbamoyltransferase complex ATPase subunit type 1 TsaE [Deltaproteobacteria bacterium]|jgi:tRNA threonylcarbamoyladenosine biosynthesis protein TsaE|nr:tRNA (adenosine(37)-N6)-threonylcarbamoyltransferase complex ATPase subunit type 1 TsaE [Deltaproteobacteria bacterium]
MISRGQAERTWRVKTKSPEQTMHLGRICGELLTQGSVIALMGDLGTGKTVFVKGVAKGVGVADEGEVTSPSFVLVNEYQGRFPVYHVDLYRLHNAEEVEDLGWEELTCPPGVTLIEWAEKVLQLLPEERTEVHLEWVSAVERKLMFVGKGKVARGLVQTLGEKWMKGD